MTAARAPSRGGAPAPNLDAHDPAPAFTQLRLVELAAPHETRGPSVRALTDRIAEQRLRLPGLAASPARTAQ
ncbi:hypothetical protein [Streptomyces gilvifuscus]|uniref:Uncharacterized protein n=1 Tax=Streptomyces gilvifuscus TaxID=1550617 RepID=A0ABT5G3N6_9ACTN|nr:hypothetical protein [Streptomyces gilvifuscus]MDC2959454.1 hypothetical protein [Streptomyces gilvifuscus]